MQPSTLSRDGSGSCSLHGPAIAIVSEVLRGSDGAIRHYSSLISAASRSPHRTGDMATAMQTIRATLGSSASSDAPRISSSRSRSRRRVARTKTDEHTAAEHIFAATWIEADVIVAAAVEHGHLRDAVIADALAVLGPAQVPDFYEGGDGSKRMARVLQRYQGNGARAVSEPDATVARFLRLADAVRSFVDDVMKATTLEEVVAVHVRLMSHRTPPPASKLGDTMRARSSLRGGGVMVDSMITWCGNIGDVITGALPTLRAVPADLKAAFSSRNAKNRTDAWKRVGIQCALAASSLACTATTAFHGGLPCSVLEIFSDRVLAKLIAERRHDANDRRHQGETVVAEQEGSLDTLTFREKLEYMWLRTHDRQRDDEATTFGALRGASSKKVWSDDERMHAQFVNMQFAVAYFGLFERMEIMSRVSGDASLSGLSLLRDVLYGRINEADALLLTITTSRYGCAAASISLEEQVGNLGALLFLVSMWSEEEEKDSKTTNNQQPTNDWASMASYKAMCVAALRLKGVDYGSFDTLKEDGEKSMNLLDSTIKDGVEKIITARAEFRGKKK